MTADPARQAAAFVELPGEGWFRLRGKDTRPYLHRMCSAHVEKVAPGESRRGLLLNVKGHVEADLTILVTAEDEAYVTVPASIRKPIAEQLEKYIIMDEVTFEDLTDETAIVTVQGPRAQEAIPASGALVARHDRSGLGGFDVAVPRAEAARLRDELVARGAAPSTREALDLLTIENGVAVFGRDFGPGNLPQEAGLDELGIVAFDKCYIGQEVVSRLHFRGHANKRLVPLELDAVPPGEAKLEKDGKEVGRVTAALLSPSLGPIGLGYVRREHATPGTALAFVSGEARGGAAVVGLPRRARGA